MVTITLKDLVEKTDQFFERYWNIEDATPQWSEPWEFNGTIPNHDQKGCYALFEGEKLVYIGLAIGFNGKGLYEGHGIGSRLHRVWRKNSKKNGEDYEPGPGYEDITSLRSIGFGVGESKDHFPIAAALEVFPIIHLKPRRNFTYKPK